MPATVTGSAARVTSSDAAGPSRRDGATTARRALGVFRLAIAVVEVVALIGNYQYVLEFPLFASVNFFSYFTVLSAMLAVATLLVAAWYALLRPVDPPLLGAFRTMVTAYLLVSGIVFGLIALQASTRDYRLEVPWSDTVLHFVVPLLALVAWTVDAVIAVNPPVPWATVGLVLVLPSLWLVYTLLRGADLGWYPYFFLDASQVGGYAGVAAYCVLVLLIFVAITAGLVAVHRGLAARAARMRAVPHSG
ncbi:Pr6Pr family membrane protein [Agromyces aurantiacus]|uniref:Pr6Pr family membrane protein n=1 Tax=Agromyces aurantiacus TaxID=165814 RepID=A0ABV9R8N9_9MICO|nr:Pr6Pr family membrane protein [Agromyces aurantiacus]MBM7503395.1 putative membrane protein [Agromyces aurantiacus]